MTAGPKLIPRGEGWMLVCPSDMLMIIVKDDCDQLITDQAFIVIRKKVER